MDLSHSLFHSFFSELFTIPYSILLDIHDSVSSLSSNFSRIDVAIPSTMYSRLASPTQCSPKIDQIMFTVETVVSQTELSYEENIGIEHRLNCANFARHIWSYMASMTTRLILNVCSLCRTRFIIHYSFTENRIILYSECPNPIYSSFILFFKPIFIIHYSASTPETNES